MTSLATAFVEAKLDTSGFGSDIKRGMSHSSVSSSVKDSGKSAGKGFSSAFGGALKIGGLLAGAFVATKGVAFFKDAITAGSDLAETANKIDVVFGKGAGAVQRFAKGAAAALGESTLQATNAAASFGVFGKAADLSGRQNAKFSTGLVKLAGDMASFSNTTPEQAVEALGAALRGESEPIRSYGVMLDEATLKAEALALGILKPVKDEAKIKSYYVKVTEAQRDHNDAVAEFGPKSLEALKAQANLGSAQSSLAKATEGTIPPLTQQQKVLAAHSAILKQTKDAQGDFSRTSDGLANQQRILSASFEDVKAKVGTALLPVMTDLIHFVNEKALPAIQDLAGFIKRDVVPVLSSMGNFVKRNSDLIMPMAVILGTVTAALGIVTAATAAWTAILALNPLTITVVALAALAAGLVIAYKRSETFRDIVDGAFEVVKTAIGAAGDAATAFLRFLRSMAGGAIDLVGSLIDAFASFVDGVLSAFGAVVDGADSAFGWIPGIGDDIGDAKDAFHSFADATVNNLHDVGDGLHDTADAVRGIPDPDIDTQTAKERAHSLAAYMKQQLAGIKDEAVTIGLTATSESTLDRLGAINIKAGGPISGAGTGTSDSIPAWLSNGEHVITADEVKKAGGHKVWEGLRRLAMNGSLHKVGDIGRFAGGGMVVDPNVTQTGFSSAVGTVSGKFASLASGISSAISSAVNTFIETMTGPARGLEFAKAQVGKPYVWGGVGPGGYDCSGYMSAIANASMGRNPYSRLGTSAGTPWPGFAGGTIGDPGFSTASTPNFGGSGIGHVWGRIAGVGVESSGGSGPHVGNTLSLGDSHASAFQHQVYDKGGILSPGYTLAYNGTGADEYVARFAKGGPVSRADRRANRQDAAQAAADAAQAAAEALRSLEQVFKHFGFGDHAAADTIRDQVRTLTVALVGVFGKDGHIVKAVKATSAALLGVAKDRDHIAAALDRSQSKLASLIIARQTLEKEIAGGFNTTVYGDGGQSTAAGLFMSARAEINDARHFKKVLQRLKAKGLAPSILKALALAGPSAIVQAESLAALSPRKLNQYEDLLQQGNRLESSLGGVVGSAVYNQQIAEQRKQTHKLNHELGQLNRRIEHLDDRIEHAVERALNHVRIELDGKRVDRALADHTHRRQRTGS